MSLGAVLHILDFVGLSLAFLDFLGLTSKIEAALSRFRDWVRGFVGYVRDDQAQALNPKRGWRSLLLGMGRDGLALAYAAGGVFFFGDRALILSWVQSVSPIWWWLMLPAVPLLLLFIHVVIIRMLVGSLTMLVSEILWRAFWLLGRPKAGVVGTIGLMLAVTGTVGDLLAERLVP